MEWGNVAVPTAQYTHAMIRCSEWTGVPLASLLDDVGVDRRRAKFAIRMATSPSRRGRSARPRCQDRTPTRWILDGAK